MGLAFRSTLARAADGARRLASALARDARGNTLVIVGIALIPLSAMIGSGVDIARGYMAQARMQQACDAGALAGRRAMANGAVDQTVKDEALKFFKFNFKTGTNGTARSAAYEATGFTPVVTDATDAPTTVVINATTTLPTVVMKMFGYTEMTLTVACNAKQDFVNTDVVLVLDSTGSMLCATTETSCSNTAEKTSSKIKSLRTAVLALYDTLAAPQTKLEAAGLRLRYGIVPYSSGVNIGKQLREMSTSYVVSDNWDYQSRVANYTTPEYSGGTTSAPTAPAVEIYSGGSISQSSCASWGNTTSTSGSPPSPVTTTTYTNTASDNGSSTTTDWGWSGSSDNSSGNRSCRRHYTSTTKSNFTVRYSFTNWTYQSEQYDVSGYTGGSVTVASIAGSTLASGPGGTVPTSGSYNIRELAALAEPSIDTTTLTWAGCIEERQTDATLAPTATSIPSGAKDLDVNLIPSDKETKWKPYWPEIEYYPSYSGNSAGKPQVACPAESRRLQAWTKANLSTYLDTLVATGGTYHDNGIRWGARLISGGGVFGPDNPATFGNMPVSKHIIFMTDGIIDTGDTLYSAYGMERFDKRVTGGWTSDADQTGRHDARFKMMCEATKGMGVSIWVVVFASTMTDSLKGCATKGQDITTTTGTQLTSAFEKIGREIGALRLTQ